MQDVSSNDFLKNKIQKLKAQGRPTRLIHNSFLDAFIKTFKLSAELKPSIKEYFSLKPQTSLIWLSLSECSGCTESMLRNENPTFGRIMLDFIRFDFHEMLMMGSGNFAQESLHKAMQEDYLLAVEGAVCMDWGEYFATFGAQGLSAKQKLIKCASNAKMIFGIGSCATFGGVQAAMPNPSNANAITKALDKEAMKRYISIPGCPPSDINIVMTLLYVILFDAPPPLSATHRPLWAYGKKVHDCCERKAKFESGEFVDSFYDEHMKDGYCLYKVGCKGPYAFNNCGKVKFNNKTSWPIQAGHGCIACCEQDFWDNFGALEEPMKNKYSYFAKKSETNKTLKPITDKEAFNNSLKGEEFGIFLDDSESFIMHRGRNILTFCLDMSALNFLQNLEQKSKLTKTLVQNYKDTYKNLYEKILASSENRISQNLADIFSFAHSLISAESILSTNLHFINKALEFHFTHISDMEFSYKIIDGRIVFDVSKGLRLILIYLLGGLEYEGIAFGVLGTMCRTLKASINDFRTLLGARECCEKITLGGVLGGNALLQKAFSPS